MEERPWTKSEFFAWSDGRRIVDLYELSKQLHCKQCRSLLDLGRTEREARYGLASVLYILCNCGVMNDVHTGRTQQDGGASNSPNLMYEINIKASINLLMYGAGASRILSFLALLDIPVPPPDDTSLIVPVTEDMQNTSSALSLPPPPSSTPASTATATGPSTKAASSDSTAPFQKAPPPSTAPSSFTPEPGFRPVPLPPGDDDDEDNDNTLPDDVENEDEDDDEDDDMDDDDEEYVPVSKSKPKPKPSPAPKKKSLLRGPKSARAKKAAKIAVKKKPPVKLKVKIKKEKEETPKKVVEEEEKQDDDQSGEQDMDPMDWSSSETETESATGKNKNSDDSWHEDDDDYREEEAGSRPKRKRGRPRGTPEKTKRTRRSAEHKTKEEKSSPKKKRVKAEGKEVPRCTTCSKEFTSVKGYNVHMKRVHNQEMKDEEELVVYACCLCQRPFPRRHCLSPHFRGMHWEHEHDFDSNHKEKCCEIPMTGMLQEVYQRGSCPAYRCRECGSQLGRGQAKAGRHLCVTPQGTASCVTLCPQGRRLNKSHMRFYLDPEAQGYVCTLCDTEFLSSRPYHKHMRHIHGQETGSQFPCPTCDRFFETALKLWRHKVAVHQAKTLVCDVCGKTCDNQLSFTDHKRQHRLGKYQCEHCPKTFARKHTWVYHTRRHTGHSLHKCQHCGKALMGNYNLRIHERIHTGEKPYKCDQCFAAFAQKNSLNWHMKKHSFAFN